MARGGSRRKEDLVTWTGTPSPPPSATDIHDTLTTPTNQSTENPCSPTQTPDAFSPPFIFGFGKKRPHASSSALFVPIGPIDWRAAGGGLCAAPRIHQTRSDQRKGNSAAVSLRGQGSGSKNQVREFKVIECDPKSSCVVFLPNTFFASTSLHTALGSLKGNEFITDIFIDSSASECRVSQLVYRL